MFSLLQYIGATVWPAESEVNPFTGPNAALLFELHKTSVAKQLIDRAESGHMDIESRRRAAELLLDWHAGVSSEAPTEHQKKTECEQDIELHRTTRLLCIEKRLFELCEAERKWFFEIDTEMREKVLALLRETSADTSDPSILYYKNALLVPQSLDAK